MPVLDNQRHEAFAQALAKGKSATEAYTEAGYKADRGAASRMSANVNVSARVTELQSMAAERVVLSREWIIAKLVENATKTQESNPSASNKALELLGKEIGMFVDRSENVNHNYEISDEPLTEAEWSEEYAAKH
jgi:phage terminase small subunit